MLRLTGEVCPNCEAKLFSPRDVCPECRRDDDNKQEPTELVTDDNVFLPRKQVGIEQKIGA